ncbi:hypothetical protein [Hydrogenovibrio marinus]|uniref:hypothetical protein n=1 Tax=Hydrogenovibrio marinus TaxID=28885 RepID=UPI0006904A43|nr:hypothetical protein [Hydrogenovibrio marinus]
MIEKHDLNKVKAIKFDNTVVRYLNPQEENALEDAVRIRNEEAITARKSANEFRQAEAMTYSLH